VVPRERAGAGSALTNTARQVAGALGVAVLGSIISQVYRGQLAPHLSAVPAAARSVAGGSITATQAVAGRLGPAGRALAGFGDSAYVHAMHITTLISAGITIVGVLVVLVWMPGRPVGTPVGDIAGTRRETAPAGAREVAEPVPVEG